MNHKKTGGALGKGLDALIKREKPAATEIDEKPPGVKGSGNKSKSSTTSATRRSATGDPTIQAVLMEVHKNPRISLWSVRSAAVLRFLKKTKPEFSISKEASALIEAAVQDKYPDIWKLFQDQDFKL
jgi:hypothetical protein